jgi:hypothetical protein
MSAKEPLLRETGEGIGKRTMERRSFLKAVAATAAATVAGSTPDAAGVEKETEKTHAKEIPMETEAQQLAAYCGRYCGTCGICEFNIAASVAAVQNVVDAAAFKRQAENLGWPLMRDLAMHCCGQFEAEVRSFAQVAPKLFPTNCRGGCVPPCQISKCCKGKQLRTCADCSELAGCSKIANMAKKYPEVKANLADIVKLGFEPWAQTQFDAAKAARKRSLTDAIEKALVSREG